LVEVLLIGESESANLLDEVAVAEWLLRLQQGDDIDQVLELFKKFDAFKKAQSCLSASCRSLALCAKSLTSLLGEKFDGRLKRYWPHRKQLKPTLSDYLKMRKSFL
jgi:hypothetical protein